MARCILSITAVRFMRLSKNNNRTFSQKKATQSLLCGFFVRKEIDQAKIELTALPLPSSVA